VLKHVHSAFFEAYDRGKDPKSNESLPMGCDVEVRTTRFVMSCLFTSIQLIIPDLKSRVLAGCNFVFSGVIPRHIQPEAYVSSSGQAIATYRLLALSSDIWILAESFGARCLPEVTSDTTHCVTATLGTEKTYRASKMSGAKVVWVNWFWKSVALWKRQNEEDFIAVPSRVESMNGSGSAKPAILLDGEGEIEEEGEGVGWDEDAQAELDAFLEGSSDVGETEDGRTDLDR